MFLCSHAQKIIYHKVYSILDSSYTQATLSLSEIIFTNAILEAGRGSNLFNQTGETTFNLP